MGQFCYLGGDLHYLPDRTLEVGSRREPPAHKPAIQILNTDTVGMGSHWVVVSTHKCNNGDVDVFDSAGGSYLRLTCLRVVAKLSFEVMLL